MIIGGRLKISLNVKYVKKCKQRVLYGKKRVEIKQECQGTEQTDEKNLFSKCRKKDAKIVSSILQENEAYIKKLKE